MGSFRRIPVAELKPLLEQALVNILDARLVKWDKMCTDLQTYKNDKRQKSWLVRLGWKKYVPFTRADAEARLKEHGGAFEPSEHYMLHNWTYSKPEEALQDLLKLCNVAKQEEFVNVSSTDGVYLHNWTADDSED